MGLMDFFKRKKGENPDPLSDLSLAKLKKGFMVDYDMKTRRVTESSYYDWGSDDITYEWQLTSADDEIIYLEREPDDEDYWSISRKIPLNSIDKRVIEHILTHHDPPNEIIHNETTFVLSETGSGRFYKGCKGAGRELIKWDFEDDSGKHFLSIEQWGENDFELSTGYKVEEYQFTNILPGDM